MADIFKIGVQMLHYAGLQFLDGPSRGRLSMMLFTTPPGKTSNIKRHLQRTLTALAFKGPGQLQYFGHAVSSARFLAMLETVIERSIFVAVETPNSSRP